MEKQKRVICSENEELAEYMLQKMRELKESPKGLSENLEKTLSKAYNSVCGSFIPINSLKDISQIKGVGKWIVKQMQGFFKSEAESTELGDITEKGKGVKKSKHYMPQKNSVAYALLITLYRETAKDIDFMGKQDLINAAEASGLSRVPIAPEKGKGKYGSSPRDWYTGWNCMKTLTLKGLVVKLSCRAKYMLTEEGKEVACECLVRSHLPDPTEDLADPAENLADVDGYSNKRMTNASKKESTCSGSSTGGLCRQEMSIDIHSEDLERFLQVGYSKEQALNAYAEVLKTSQNKDISSLWPTVLCHLQEDKIYGPWKTAGKDFQGPTHCSSKSAVSVNEGQVHAVGSQSIGTNLTSDDSNKRNVHSANHATSSFTLKPCSSSDYVVKSSKMGGLEANKNALSMPPLNYGERFENVYEVILILDDREQYASQGSRYMKLLENICKEHRIKIKVRRLPVGDGIWMALHKFLKTEYVLDFIVERKKIDDLRSSIRDNRYRDKKLRLLRCGLKKLIYLVEGDPNTSESSESIKTVCFTTEILEGFDVQRTNSLPDTLKKYGHFTQSIMQYYQSVLPENQKECSGTCPPFSEFVNRCQELDKVTISDVFAIQLTQVSQVAEEVALAVLDLYPTLFSLAYAYKLLDGDVRAQEEMLRKQSNNSISAVAGRNIFQLVWGGNI